MNIENTKLNIAAIPTSIAQGAARAYRDASGMQISLSHALYGLSYSRITGLSTHYTKESFDSLVGFDDIEPRFEDTTTMYGTHEDVCKNDKVCSIKVDIEDAEKFHVQYASRDYVILQDEQGYDHPVKTDFFVGNYAKVRKVYTFERNHTHLTPEAIAEVLIKNQKLVVNPEDFTKEVKRLIEANYIEKPIDEA